VAFTALYDACVLYPAPIRDVLMHLALTDLFRARWTDEIHEEWIRSVLKNRPDLSRERLIRTRDLMNSHVRDALIRDYQDLIPALSLPDPNDRHVLAAAIKGRADVVVTYNTRDFPEAAIARYGISAQHPDAFLTHLFDLAPGVVLGALQRLRQSLKNPPVESAEYLSRLEQHELSSFVANLREFQGLL
jgi:predicted nucleic acid-binding protein